MNRDREMNIVLESDANDFRVSFHKGSINKSVQFTQFYKDHRNEWQQWGPTRLLDQDQFEAKFAEYNNTLAYTDRGPILGTSAWNS